MANRSIDADAQVRPCALRTRAVSAVKSDANLIDHLSGGTCP